MTFYELKGLLVCEQPIFHPTTGGMEKAVEKTAKWSGKPLPSHPALASRMLAPCLLEVGAGAKTRCREPGSRPQAGKVQIGKQVDRGDPRMRPLLGLKPLTKQYVTCSSCSRRSRRPGPSAAIVYCSRMVDTSIGEPLFPKISYDQGR